VRVYIVLCVLVCWCVGVLVWCGGVVHNNELS
jgi:hypothetical protein